MNDAAQDAALTIGDLVARTGVSEGTLRMWERRHGFPTPARLPSGHRRYRESDVDLVLQVVRERTAGLSLPVAIARALEAVGEGEPSIFAGLRRHRPELQPIRLRKPVLLALSRAIEDESCARAERQLLFGAFQRERFYRQSERRWREFARTAELAVVFADFKRRRRPANAPIELQIEGSAPLNREWAVVCEAPGHAVCLAGVELQPARRPRDDAREFEVIWSVEPQVVRAASEICLGLARRADPRLADRLEARTAPAPPPPAEQLRLAAAITTRTLGALS
jgi:DICT domain-containing protein/predicted DNA-binding transcriptional regulator AlpA